MQFPIEPYVGAGPIRLGMTSQEIQNALSEVPKKFKKFKDDEFQTDSFKTFFAYYKRPGVCEAIEFHQPADVTFRGVQLLNVPFEQSRKMFESLDDGTVVDNTSLTSYKYGIGLYAPFADDEPNLPPEGVIVFERNYYDS
jgi:hypothetical protein